MVEMLLINTSLGSSVLGLEDRVFSNVDDGFLEKPASDLNVGESVLYEKNYIDSSLDEIEPFLRMSDRYRSAEQMLHEVNAHGRFIPKLRTKLIRGAAQRGLISEDNLEDKILLNEEDISRESYRILIEEIRSRLEAVNLGVADSTIDSWLKGETLSPREWATYPILAEINPEFIEFNSLDRRRCSNFFNYKLYTTIRQGIMRWLTNPRHGPPREEHEPEDTLGISLSQEIQLVFDHFVRNISSEYAAAQVLEIRELYRRAELVRRSRNEPKLRRGVLTSRNDLTEARKRDVGEIILNKKILEGTFYEVIDHSFKERIDDYLNNLNPLEKIKSPTDEILSDERYKQILNSPLGGMVKEIIEGEQEKNALYNHDFIKKIGNRLFASEIINRYVSINGEPQFRNIHTFYLSRISQVDFEELHLQFMNELSLGNIDSKIGAPLGTTLRLLDLLKRHHRSIPRSILKYQELEEEEILAIAMAKVAEQDPLPMSYSSKDRLKEAERKQRKLADRIKSRYPYFTDDRSLDIGLVGNEYTIEQRDEFLNRHNLSSLLSLN